MADSSKFIDFLLSTTNDVLKEIAETEEIGEKMTKY